MTQPDLARRRLLRYGLNGLGAIACGKLLLACNGNPSTASLTLQPRELTDSGVEGLLLPPGFSARVIARSSQPVLAGHDYHWHPAPDGGAVFPTDEGGWIYVSNSEMGDGAGGVGAIRFDSHGETIGAWPILSNTSRNCAGGPTPWHTWLSCEETPDGLVWECDPRGEREARALPALGRFMHEAAAVDPQTLQVFLTEDRPDGRFYRFTPAAIFNGIPDLDNGVLEVARVGTLPEGKVSWLRVDDPSGHTPTRHQVPESTVFRGGEGAWQADGIVYFTTKHDNRVWAYDLRAESISLIYDAAAHASPVLTGVDNVTVSRQGTIFVAEDGGNMEIVAINPGDKLFPILRLPTHAKSEITGPAFDPGGTRLYFSSQRGASGSSRDGVTFEVTGPFHVLV